MKPDARLLVVLVLAALPAAGHPEDAGAPLAERSELAAEARGVTSVEVDNARGRVVVRPSSDGRIHVTATRIAHFADPAAARRYLSETSVVTAERNGRYEVEVHYPRRIETSFTLSDLFNRHGRHPLTLPSLEAVLELAIPERLPIRVRTVSGDVAADAMAGPMDVGTTSGDVRLDGLRGAVAVETVSGDVSLAGGGAARLRTTSGDVEAHGTRRLDCRTVSGDIGVDGPCDSLTLATESGDMEVAAVAGGLDARTASGGIAVHGAAGSVRVSSASGDIQVRLQRPLRGADLRSASGEVNVDLAPGLGAQLSASSGSGNIDCRAPLAELRHGQRSLAGRIGSGGPTVRIQTGSGDLTVTSGGK